MGVCVLCAAGRALMFIFGPIIAARKAITYVPKVGPATLPFYLRTCAAL